MVFGFQHFNILLLKDKGNFSDFKVQQLISVARIWGLLPLVNVSQIDIGRFISNLTAVQRKSNYLQELMVVKAFSNSIEISKAVHFMEQLSELHVEYLGRALKFAEEQADILNSFDLLGQVDAMEEIQTGLESAFRSLDQQISFWISNVVFQGSSFGLALKTILQT